MTGAKILFEYVGWIEVENVGSFRRVDDDFHFYTGLDGRGEVIATASADKVLMIKFFTQEDK